MCSQACSNKQALCEANPILRLKDIRSVLDLVFFPSISGHIRIFILSALRSGVKPTLQRCCLRKEVLQNLAPSVPYSTALATRAVAHAWPHLFVSPMVLYPDAIRQGRAGWAPRAIRIQSARRITRQTFPFGWGVKEKKKNHSNQPSAWKTW